MPTPKKSLGARTHGQSYPQTPTYRVWYNMKARCRNKRLPAYAQYGGRGIEYDKRWEMFENFLEDMGERPDGMTLERIDNNAGYSKENCVWASRKEQARNRRNTVIVECDGRSATLAEWAEEMGCSYGTMWSKYKRGNWPK